MSSPTVAKGHVDIEAQSEATPRSLLERALYLCIAGLAYITMSAGMINFNKFLMNKDRFPFSVVLVLLHMGFSSTLTFGIYLARPGLFPALDPSRRSELSKDVFLKGIFPVAVLFSVSLVLCNTAYMHSSVAFLQMMKEGNIVLVYALSLVAGLERFAWRNVVILLGIAIATSVNVKGEIHFSMQGFCLQIVAAVFECSKIVLQAVLLTGKRKLNALTYVLLVNPVSFVVLSTTLAMFTLSVPGTAFGLPTWVAVVQWWPYLLANCAMAFVMNLLMAVYLSYASGVGLIFAGVVKDAMIVATGVLVFHEAISSMQMRGFMVQLLLILTWSLLKAFPKEFEHGIVPGLHKLLSFPGREKEGETKKLVG